MKLPINPWEHHNAIKTLYAHCVGQTCHKHQITRMELDILLFLANNPMYDTAKDIIQLRYLSKSQVSTSVKLLEERGYIRRLYQKANRKTAHLIICDAARPIIADGQKAQEQFLSVMTEGIPEIKLDCMKQCMEEMMKNINRCLREENL